MNFVKNLFWVATFIISYTQLIAQNTEGQKTSGKKWYVKGSQKVSDTTALSFIEYPSFKDGLIMVNNKATIEWEILIDGKIIGISKRNAHALVFYKPKGNAYEIKLATVNLSTQKIIDDKPVYKGKGNVLTEIHNDASGNFSQLLVCVQSRITEDFIKEFNLITLNADGTAVTKQLASVEQEGRYIGNTGGKDGSIFLVSVVKGSMVVEKFSHEGALISKLETPISLRKVEPWFRSVVRTDPFTDNAVFVNLNTVNKEKEKAFSYLKFNFDDNKVAIVNEPALDKKSPYKFDNYDNLRPVDIQITTDKVVMVREVQYTESINRGGNSMSFFEHSKTIVVSIYDKQMKLDRELEISKHTSSHSFADIGLACHVYNDKLYILSGENAGKTFDSYCYTVNLNDGKWDKRKIGSNDPSTTTSIYTRGTIWLSNEFIMSHLHIGFGAGTNRYSTVLESVTYDKQ